MARTLPTFRCAGCRGRFTLPLYLESTDKRRLVRCPYCGCAADARATVAARLAQALGLRLSRLSARARRRLWALEARGRVRTF